MPTLTDESIPVDRAGQTRLSWLAPFHHHLRWRFGWYQHWHEHPHTRKVHYGISVLALVVATSSIVISVRTMPPVQAAKTGNVLIYYHSL